MGRAWWCGVCRAVNGGEGGVGVTGFVAAGVRRETRRACVRGMG